MVRLTNGPLRVKCSSNPLRNGDFSWLSILLHGYSRLFYGTVATRNPSACTPYANAYSMLYVLGSGVDFADCSRLLSNVVQQGKRTKPTHPYVLRTYFDVCTPYSIPCRPNTRTRYGLRPGNQSVSARWGAGTGELYGVHMTGGPRVKCQ